MVKNQGAACKKTGGTREKIGPAEELLERLETAFVV
jgi:hypothetical protein